VAASPVVASQVTTTQGDAVVSGIAPHRGPVVGGTTVTIIG
jgi:hypothetical protein